MAEMQKKETDWKEREAVMQRRMEEAMKLIKNLKTRVDQMEGEKTSGESTETLQYKVKIASLEKQKKSYEMDLKSIKAELDIKTVLESKKSRLVDLLDVKLQEKQKLVDLLQLKCNHQNAKVALADARVAQLERDKCEMALYLETMRQHMKKCGLEVGEPYEVRAAQEKELKQRLEDGIAAVDKLTAEAKAQQAEGSESSTANKVESPESLESKDVENRAEGKAEDLPVPKSTEVSEKQDSSEAKTTPSLEAKVAEQSDKEVQSQNDSACAVPEEKPVQPCENQAPVENQLSENKAAVENKPSENPTPVENQPSENEAKMENKPSENQVPVENQPSENQVQVENQIPGEQGNLPDAVQQEVSSAQTKLPSESIS